MAKLYSVRFGREFESTAISIAIGGSHRLPRHPPSPGPARLRFPDSTGHHSQTGCGERHATAPHTGRTTARIANHPPSPNAPTPGVHRRTPIECPRDQPAQKATGLLRIRARGQLSTGLAPCPTITARHGAPDSDRIHSLATTWPQATGTPKLDDSVFDVVGFRTETPNPRTNRSSPPRPTDPISGAQRRTLIESPTGGTKHCSLPNVSHMNHAEQGYTDRPHETHPLSDPVRLHIARDRAHCTHRPGSAGSVRPRSEQC
jgi:hypothetical protein